MKRLISYSIVLALFGCGSTSPEEQFVLEYVKESLPDANPKVYLYKPEPASIVYGAGSDSTENKEVILVALEDPKIGLFVEGFLHQEEIFPASGGRALDVFQGDRMAVPFSTNLMGDDLREFIKGDRSKELIIKRVNYPKLRASMP